MATQLRTQGKEYKAQKYKRKLFVDKGAGKAQREKKRVKTEEKRAVRVSDIYSCPL